jgi:adenosine deaminase
MLEPAPQWIPIIDGALASGDPAQLVAIPKADLHCHGLLSVPVVIYEHVLGRTLPPAPRPFGDFDRFSQYIAEHLFPAIQSASGVRLLIRGAFDRLVADGVVYAEMSFDLLLPEAIGLSAEQFAELLAEEMDRVAAQVTVAPEIGLNRVVPAADVVPLLRAWLATGVYRSIDLYGDENLGEVADFAPLYALAAEHGLKRKAHAGELCGADRVRTAIELLGLDAVHHGVRAADDAAVVALLAERGIVLHICPTSNVLLGISPSFAEHPARRLFDAGVPLTVNTDDFTLFGASCCDELLNLGRMGFTAAEIAHIVATGLAQQGSG